MQTSGKADNVIQDMAGCGRFQFFLIFSIDFIGLAATALSMMFMVFGMYNPGWTCLDNGFNTTDLSLISWSGSVDGDTSKNISQNVAVGNEQSPVEIAHKSCRVFESCNQIQFDPTTSTIVTEWGLLCGQSWVPTFIVSLQMSGVLVGALLFGQLGDSFGRKTTIIVAHFMIAIFNILSIFSVSWQMFAVLRFLLGMACASLLCLYYVYIAEFTTIRWRAPVAGIPSWGFSCVLYGLVLMWLRDWRHVHIVIVAVTIVGIFPLFWAPESLRWLEVNHKTTSFMRVARKIIEMNGKTLNPRESFHSISDKGFNRQSNTKTYSILDVFRHGYRTYSIIIGLSWFTASSIYYAITFGIKGMYGNFYINFIIINLIEIPLKIGPAFALNLVDRRRTGCAMIGATSIILFTTAGFSQSSNVYLKTTGVRVLLMATKITAIGYWTLITAHTSEIYPTVVRSLGQNWGSLMARVGGIVCPFLIPKDQETAYISYVILGIIGLICCGAALKLPETRGKHLQETFDDSESVANI